MTFLLSNFSARTCTTASRRRWSRLSYRPVPRSSMDQVNLEAVCSHDLNWLLLWNPIQSHCSCFNVYQVSQVIEKWTYILAQILALWKFFWGVREHFLYCLSSSFSTHWSQHSKFHCQIIMWVPRLELGTAGCKERKLPLCHAVPFISYNNQKFKNRGAIF